MPVDAALRDEAVSMMKEHRLPDTVYAHLVSRGVDINEAHALVTELVALKQKADALDPNRLREEAKWMLFRGANVEDAVAHFVRAGIAEEHARPEIVRILALVKRLRPCQRCGAPVAPEEMVFDLRGLSVCNRCNLQDEIGRSEQRGIASTLESVGMSPMFAEAASGLAQSFEPQVTRPVCAHCRIPSGVHVSALLPEVRARIDPRASWLCGQCGQVIA
jgi:hypothetical protein